MSSFTKTVSKKQLAANRANAEKSTGPRSETGKQASSQNRAWHGLTGRFKVLKGEIQEEFDDLFNQFVADEKPVGSTELELVRKMAEYTWLRERATRFHESCFFVEDATPELIAAGKAVIRVNPELDKFIRYQAHYDRAYARASAELLKRQKQRYLLQSGFESQKRAHAQEIRREKQQEHREEKHMYWTAERKLDIQLKESRVKAAAAAQNQQAAA